MSRILVLIWACLSACSLAAGDVKPSDLRCEYNASPLGIDTTQPRLFWKLASVGRGARQTAYQVLVASSEEQLRRHQGDLWDSGKVGSDRSVFVPYAGRSLTSRQRCVWKVRVWDQTGAPSAWRTVGRSCIPLGRTRYSVCDVRWKTPAS